MDIYNPTAPFLLEKEPILAARVEPRGNHESRVFLFREKNGTWHPLPDWQPLNMEDPFFFRLGNTPLLGGVETFPDNGGASMGWRTTVYDVSNLENPRLIFQGPSGMKDIRFIEYSDGRIGVFTRPQGGTARRGTCGYLETDSIYSLTVEKLSEVPLISSPDQDSWEGINQPILLGEDRVGLLGHTAWMEHGEIRHYYAAVSEFSRKTLKKTPWQIIAQRSELPPGPARRENLTDVLFPGGIDLLSSSEAVLYLGVSDVQAWKCRIPNPFSPSK